MKAHVASLAALRPAYIFVFIAKDPDIIHAQNTEEEVDAFINELLTCAKRQVYKFASSGSASGSKGGSGVVRGCESET